MTNFQKFLVLLNGIGACLAALMLVTTFFGKSLLISQAQRVAMQKASTSLEKAFSMTEELLAKPMVAIAVPEKTKETIEQEITAYRTNPAEWIREIGRKGAARAKDFEFPEVKNPIARKAINALTEKVASARTHFEDSFQNLILDLRIFCGVNLVSFLLAGWMCRWARTPQAKFWLTFLSLILLTATVISISFYVDQNWAWRILQNRYQGWGYLGTLLAVFSLIGVYCLPEIWMTQKQREK